MATDDQKIRFAIIGDYGQTTSDAIFPIDQVGEAIRSWHPDFILTLGDNFYEDGVASVDDPQWKTKFEDVYDAKSLVVPIYASLGNHDRVGECIRPIAESFADLLRWFEVEIVVGFALTV